MIAYDPKGWLPLLFSYNGTVIPRVIGRVAVLAAVTLGVWLVTLIAPETTGPVIKPFKPLGHTLIGVALGLLIVFRNNCSYDRYWEGRKLWGGIVNTSRNLLRGAAAYAGDAKDLANLIAAYTLALKQHLRGNKDLSEVQPLVPQAVLDHAAGTTNPPSILAYYMTTWVRDRMAAGQIDTVTAQGFEAQVRALLDNQGGCERILRTPIPFAYAVHIKHLLMLYLVTLPFILVGEMSWVAIPTVAAIAFGLLGIEEAGVEIEDPFRLDPNHLPLDAICEMIRRDVDDMAAGERS